MHCIAPIPTPVPRLLNVALPCGVLAALLFAGCADLESPDETQLQAEDEASELPPPPDLSEAEIAALRAERTVASLPVQNAGLIEIVNAATIEAPEYTYIAIGGALTTDVLRQLVTEQGATAAEVFLALADADEALPAALLVDHRVRAEQDRALDASPRRLVYVAPRALELDNLDCHSSGGNPKTFANWLLDWDDRFEFINFKTPNRFTDRNTTDGITYYNLAADSFGSVMSACNAGYNDIGVVFWMLTFAPGPYYPYTYVVGAPLDSFEAIHLYSTSATMPHLMGVSHTHPAPNTYVAYGRCGNSDC